MSPWDEYVLRLSAGMLFATAAVLTAMGVGALIVVAMAVISEIAARRRFARTIALLQSGEWKLGE